ncbi:MAG: glycosylhydrolase-like jelly roll fold domain-containing protein, partial [Verrucomicrobiota bacterium]
QSVLQSGRPDNDILLYWPIHDFWQQPGDRLLPHFNVHSRGWFEAQPIGKTAKHLWNRGYAFDYVSDRQLATAKAGKSGTIRLPGSSYGVVVVPPCDCMPALTLQNLISLARAGATVGFESHLPKDSPGFANLEKQRAKFKRALREVKLGPATGKFQEAKIGNGRVLVGELESALAGADVAREAMFDHAGLMCLRRAYDNGHDYFIANRGEQEIDDWITLARRGHSVVLMDGLSGRVGAGELRPGADGKAQVHVQLAPGQSVVLRMLAQKHVDGPVWADWRLAGSPGEIKGTWRVEFIAGGPTLPRSIQTDQLASWTEFGGAEAQRFAGTARYSIAFDAPDASVKQWLLDFGKVCQSLRVRLNGRDWGTLIMPPFRVVVDEMKPTSNLLEVEVTNVSANRIRDLDRRGVKWKNFHDINFVNLNYKPFDASEWPLYDSGLLGPVTVAAIAP